MGGFAAWLFGLAAEQPREYRRLLRIRARIYTPVAKLDARIATSDEPVPFARLDPSAFRPLRAGTAWGKKLDCAWIHVTGTVPAAHPDAVVMFGIRGEGLVYAPNGDPVDSVSTVWIQADLPHSAAKYRPLEHVDTSGGTVDFYADVAYNGFLLYPYGNAVYHGAHLAVRDEQLFALYYDYLTLSVLAGATDDRALASDLRRALATAYRAFSAGDARAARAALADSLAAPSTSEFVYSAIGHGHLDMAWLWPLRETHRKAARTYTRAVNTIDDRSEYLYGTSQPQQLQWMKDEQPALFDRIRDAVAAGRIEPQGSFWVEPDTNLPSGESLVRQVIMGRRFLQDEFALADEDLRLCWLPDTFGYNGNLPQILKKSGMDWFQTIKLAWNKVNDFPHRTFNWQGIDGSTVLVHMPPEGRLQQPRRRRRAAEGNPPVSGARPQHRAARLRCGRRRRRPRRGAPRVAQTRAEPARSAPGGGLDGGRLLPLARETRHPVHPRRRALPRDPSGHVHDTGGDQAPQPGRRTDAAQRRSPRCDRRPRQS